MKIPVFRPKAKTGKTVKMVRMVKMAITEACRISRSATMVTGTSTAWTRANQPEDQKGLKATRETKANKGQPEEQVKVEQANKDLPGHKDLKAKMAKTERMV